METAFQSNRPGLDTAAQASYSNGQRMRFGVQAGLWHGGLGGGQRPFPFSLLLLGLLYKVTESEDCFIVEHGGWVARGNKVPGHHSCEYPNRGSRCMVDPMADGLSVLLCKSSLKEKRDAFR